MVTYTKKEQFICKTEEDLFDLGYELAKNLPHDATILLEGTLGAGKTLLVRGFMFFLGIHPQQVASPTFALVHSYTKDDLEIKHLDLYRLTHKSEWYQLGIEEELGKKMIFVEWPELMKADVPLPKLEISITIASDESRGVDVTWYLAKKPS